LQPAQPALVPRHRGGAPDRRRSVRLVARDTVGSMSGPRNSEARDARKATSSEDIAVVGAGSYGTCLAVLFGNAGHRVSLYCRGAEQAAAIAAARENTA